MNKKIFLTSVLLVINLCFCCLENQLNLFIMDEFKITQNEINVIKTHIRIAYDALVDTKAFYGIELYNARVIIDSLSDAANKLDSIAQPF